MPKNLFIDTNIYLSFYRFSKDDLEELGKLVILKYIYSVKLYIPQQVFDEFNRNRDKTIHDSLSVLDKQLIKQQYPNICKPYPEYEKLKKINRKYNETLNILIQKIKTDSIKNKLNADNLINYLLENGHRISLNDNLISVSNLRMNKGNPPGERNSFGDAIIWESLLDSVPNKEDLYFISDDSHYCSSLDNSAFNNFLLKEWQLTKQSNIHFYKYFSLFIKDQFPDINLSAELDKHNLIVQLLNSENFQMTHDIISQLQRFDNFTTEQANNIINAVISNNQVYWIISDTDIATFVEKIIGTYKDKIDPKYLKKINVLKHQEREGNDIESNNSPF